MTTEPPRAVGAPLDAPVRPLYEHGFWWWYDKSRKGWFTGCAPAFGTPKWAK